MLKRNDQLDAWDRAHFFHPATHMAGHARGETPGRIIEGAEGVHVVDRDGNRFLDAFAGLYCVNIGYGRREVADAIAKQAHELAYYHAYAGHASEASIRLAKMIIDRAPQGMSRVFFGLGGSDANDTNVKLVWYMNNVLGRPEKKKIIARRRGYHGSGVLSASLTGLDLYHKAFDLPLGPVLHTEAPYFFRRADRSQTEEEFTDFLAARLEELILAEGPETIAAFVAEPLLGTGGIVPPPAGYWQKVQPILERHDILLVVDEVITGFGRLGTMFGSDFYDLRPDLMTIAKGLTSAYAPLSGSIVSEKVWKVLEEGSDTMGPIGHGWTYSAHPLCAAAGVANLKVLDDLNLTANAAEVGPYLTRALAEALAGQPLVGEVRGEGMLAAVELVRDAEGPVFFEPAAKVAPRVVEAMGRRGIIARAMPQSDIVGFAPPLCLTRPEADLIVDATRGAIDEVAHTL
jgi:L-2,4-diaminobutyrate transaminase